MSKEDKKTKYSKVDIDTVAQTVEMLFVFSGQLIPHMDMLEDLLKSSQSKLSFAQSAAPVLMASGIDYVEKEMTAKLYARRADALLNLVKILAETEQARKEFLDKQGEREKNRQFLNKILGA